MKRRIGKPYALLCLLLAVLLPLPSCLKISAEEVSAGYERKETDPGAVAEAFPGAYLDFAFGLYEILNGKTEAESALLSPLSALLCLGMVENGMSGETLAETERAFGIDRDTMNRSLYAFVSSLKSGKDSRFTTASSVWVREGAAQPKGSFLQTNADWYGAEVYRAPFDESTKKDINLWADRKTDGMIPSLPLEFDADTVIALLSAVAFDAKWEEPYHSDQVLKDRTFHAGNGEDVTVTMLSSEEKTWMENDRFYGFAKSYRGGAYSFAAFLPKEGTDVNGMTAEDYAALWNGRENAAVTVLLPEFTGNCHLDLKPALQAMGIAKAFVGGEADFSGMSEEEGLYLEAVEQQTFVDVNREGTKAAAVTWALVDAESEVVGQKEVILDRPFVYVIADAATGLPLFLGCWQG